MRSSGAHCDDELAKRIGEEDWRGAGETLDEEKEKEKKKKQKKKKKKKEEEELCTVFLGLQ